MYLTESMVGWHRAWAELAKVHADFGTRDAHGEGWQYMGSYDPPEEGGHCFRHRNKGGFHVPVLVGDEVEEIRPSMNGGHMALQSIIARLARLEQPSRMFGGPEAVETQFRTLVELRQLLLRPRALMLDPYETRDAYCRFVATLNGADTNWPLHVTLREEGRLAELATLLGDFGRWMSVEYPPESL